MTGVRLCPPHESDLLMEHPTLCYKKLIYTRDVVGGQRLSTMSGLQRCQDFSDVRDDDEGKGEETEGSRENHRAKAPCQDPTLRLAALAPDWLMV